MLYGNIIFIKRTGGDGSKFPVTEKYIKIGRSEECLIRVYNPKVAPEHCHLIIEENGQAVLRNLSDQEILNGKPTSNKDVVLCHGDIFKVGERLARWEYLPTSKYYRQLLSPTGRLVAVVMPQQRPLGGQVTPRASVKQSNVSNNTPLGKRRYSEQATAETSSAVKKRKSSGTELIHKSRGNLSKFLAGRHSVKSTKMLVQGGKFKERKSISGVMSSKTPKRQVGGKLRKSTLPSWKVNAASPQEEISSYIANSSLKRKSVKSSSTVKVPPEDLTESESSEKYLSTFKSKAKTPQKALSSKSSEEAFQGVLKTPLKAIKQSPSKSNRVSPPLILKKTPKKTSSNSPSNIVSSTPQSKSVKLARLIHSESKISSISKKRSSLPKGSKRKTLMFEKVIFTTPKKSLIKTSPVKVEDKSFELNLKKTIDDVSEKILETFISKNEINEASLIRKTIPSTQVEKTPVLKTPRRSKETKSKSSAKKNKNATVTVTEKQLKTARVSISNKLNAALATQGNTFLINLDNIESPKHSSRESTSTKSTPLKKTPAKSVKKLQTPSSRQKISVSQNETSSSSFSSPVDKTPDLSPVRSSRKSKFSFKKLLNLESIEGKSSSPSKGTVISRGIQRKLSPSSSAEIAAKKLKTSSPKKPDKNKKAALLVLGKANRKQLISQNVKVLLKQKIVKKALKQSGAVSGHKEESRKKVVSKTKEAPQKKASGKIKKGSRKKPAGKLKRESRKPAKADSTSKKSITSSKTSPSKNSKASGESAINFPSTNVTQEDTSKDIKALEESQLNISKVLQTPSRFSSKNKPVESATKSLSKQKKKSESPSKIDNETISPSSTFEKTAENYLLNSFRRSSKRLSSKNDTGRPDFIELTPTALGLMPKNLEIFKTPKEHKRRSSSLVTPKNIRTTGIIKSASTSKIVNRKSVRFSPKNVSYNSEFSSPNLSDKTDFDFSSFHTPNVTMDVFISPLSEKSIILKDGINEFKRFVEEEISKSTNKNSRSNSESKLCVRKLLKSKKSSDVSSSSQKEFLGNSKTPVTKLTSPVKVLSENKSSENNINEFQDVRQQFETPKSQKSSKNNLSDVKRVSKLLQTPEGVESPKKELVEVKENLRVPKMRKSPRNDLTDVRGVKKLLQTPKVQKSPKNDLTDVRGVKKLLQTPKAQKSPKNDLTDVRGVKKLLKTPRVQKSPKNDLTDVRGVKKLLKTPRVQKSPKNDLTDVRGVKKLLQTPKAQKSPKNDLSDVRGVKRLLQTPKTQKSPKNDLSDVKGVKRLLQTPKTQKSPKNDLSDVKGVKRLLQTPKTQKSPKNDLTDVRGVKRLLQTPKAQKSPKNDLTDVRGVKKLLQTPKVQKSPKNDLTDVRGVKKLLRTPKAQKSPKNDLTDVRGVKKLLQTPKTQKNPKNELTDLRGVKKLLGSPKFQKSPKNNLLDVSGMSKLFESPVKLDLEKSVESLRSDESLSKNSINITEVHQQLISKSPENISKDKKAVYRKSRVSDFRAIRGRRTIYSTPKSPKNDLSDVMGVRELFIRHKPTSDYNVNLIGVAELFDLPESDAVSRTGSVKNVKESPLKVTKIKSLRSRKVTENQDERGGSVKMTTRGIRSRKATKGETDEEASKTSKVKASDSKEKKPAKRKAVEKVKTVSSKKVSVRAKKSQQTTKKPGEKLQKKTKIILEDDNVEVKSSRKRKAVEVPELSPPRLRRKMRGAEGSSSTEAKETPQKSVSRSKSKSESAKKISVKRVQKVSAEVTGRKMPGVSSKVQIKKAIKTSGTKKIQTVQSKRSHNKSKNISGSEKSASPRKTRSKVASTETVRKGAAGTGKSSPAMKRSTRQKVK